MQQQEDEHPKLKSEKASKICPSPTYELHHTKLKESAPKKKA
jgi:hypothetical protein